MVDPFGDRRGLFEYTSILARLKKLKNRFAPMQNNPNASSSCSSTSSSTTKHPPMDARTREIMNDAAALDSNPSNNDNVNLDDIFDHEDDEPDSSMDDEDDDEDENEELNLADNVEQSKKP